MKEDGLTGIVSTQLGKARDYWHLHSEGSTDSLQWRELPSGRSLIWSEEGGATAFLFALIATGVIATIGLGIDVIGWYRAERALQNAADAAAIAAARKGPARMIPRLRPWPRAMGSMTEQME